jgi:hypothetical protein
MGFPSHLFSLQLEMVDEVVSGHYEFVFLIYAVVA